jgi:hypothetical protein
MEVLDLLLDSARRHVRHDEEDVREWARAVPPADDGVLLRARIVAVAARLRATFAELAEVERLFQRAAQAGHLDPTVERHIKDGARRQAANAGALLELVQRLPDAARPEPGVIGDLRMLEFEARELLDVMEGEADLRQGMVRPWEDVRTELGL